MKGVVVFYSATGNTGKVAKAIHRGMKGVIGDCDIAAIKNCDPRDMAKYDLIGIGAPIWYFREPANVRLFIENMPRLDGKLCFPFCVHGAAPVGFFFSIAPALQRKGLTVIGWKDWYGSVDQVLHMPKPYFTDGHPDAVDLREAEEFGREMAERAGRIAAGERSLIPELPRGKGADQLWGPNTMRPPTADGKARFPDRAINTEKCLYPDCTICADNCLMNSIDLTASPPVIRKSCISCNLCNRMCPVAAIEPDEGYLQQSQTAKTINLEKCRYPECTLCIDHCPMNSIDFSVSPPVFKWNCEGDDLCWVICPTGAIEISNVETVHDPKSIKNMEHPFVRMMEEAEAAGRFRRLTPLDKIGWDNLICNIKKLPRFVIEEEDVS
jgi:formate hydrogenlyase subunit 6/NADH:ubiquinone oxidoreductase subunit I